MKQELRALNFMKKHNYCTYKNFLCPFPQYAEPFFSICCIYAPCSRFTSEVFRMPKSWRTWIILHLTTWLPIWIPWEMKFWREISSKWSPYRKSLCRMPAQAFQSALSNAENGRQPSKGDKEPNVFHRYIYAVNMPVNVWRCPWQHRLLHRGPRKPHQLRELKPAEE